MEIRGDILYSAQVEAYVVKKQEDWVVVTVITKFF
jgi:hypothetical protein